MNPELEKFIGKPIDEVLKFGKLELENNRFYSFKLKKEAEFFGIQYGYLQIIVDTNRTIESASINFPLILDRIFYDEMIENYGNLNSILATDKLIGESKTERHGEFNQTLAKREYSLKEASFEDKPFFVYWKNEYYQIKMTFYYEYNATQLAFRKPTGNF